MTRFWNWIDQQTEDGQPERVLEINGTIAEESWFDDEITPEMFKSELNSGEGDIEVYINSPGGDCIAASRISTMLMEYKGSVTVKVDGLAASAASVIAMAGSSVLMAPTAMMMIHNPATLAWGDHNDMEKAIEQYKQQDEDVLSYALFPQVATEFFQYRDAQQKKIDISKADTNNMTYPV